MPDLTIVTHEMFGELPLLTADNVEWFGATEAAKALSFSDPHKAIINHVDADDSTVHPVIDKLGRKQRKKFVNESGLYALIFGASKQGNNPEIRKRAKKFKHWVTHEVLPSIRKHGMYMTSQLAQEITNNPEIIHYIAEQVAKINTVNNQYHEQTNNKLEAIDKKIEGEYVTPQDLYAIGFATKVRAEKYVDNSGLQMTIDTFLAGNIYEQARANKQAKEQRRYEIGRIKRRILVAVKKHLGMKGNAPNNHIKRKDVDTAIQYIKNLPHSELVI